MNDRTGNDSDQRLISEKVAKQVKEILAEHLGTEPDDIEDEDSFIDDLNMTPSEIYDFMHSLNEADMDTASMDIKEIDTVGDLIEILSADESF